MNLSYMAMGYAAMYLKPLYLFVLLMQLFSFKYYEIYSDRETTNNIVKQFAGAKKFTKTRHFNGKDVLSGFYFCRKFIAFVDRTQEQEVIYLFATVEHYKLIVDQMEEPAPALAPTPAPARKQTVQVLIRKGSFKNFYYPTLRLDVTHITPLGGQVQVVADILALYEKKGQATIFLHGVTCAGKSTVGYLVAKELKSKFCHSFNPSDPGDQLSVLVQDAGEDPLVIVLEEVDGLILAIHGNRVERHNKDVPVCVYDKTSWANFLDDMVFFKNVILLMTSNKSKEEIDALDPAYLRRGRVHLSASMLEPLEL